jgi:hypothetical protein
MLKIGGNSLLHKPGTSNAGTVATEVTRWNACEKDPPPHVGGYGIVFNP